MIAEKTIADLNPDEVASNLEELQARIAESNPNIDTGRGVFRDLVLFYHAVLSERLNQNLLDYWNARSLKAIEADPTLADPDLVDDVLSNFRLERKAGSTAVGEVAVIRNVKTTLTIALGAEFIANGKSFVTTQVYTAKFEEAQLNSDTDRLITSLNDGNFIFTIDVVASDVGADFLITKDTLVVPVVIPNGYLTSYATSSFRDGLNEETNSELINRLQQGIAARTLSNRVNMAAMLRNIDTFSRIVSMSIVGYGDAEMIRDRHTIFPGSFGGRVDWYIRSEELLRKTGVTKTATLIDKTVDSYGIWQVTFNRDEVSGIYEVRNIQQADAENVSGSYRIEEEIRQIDVSNLSFKIDIITVEEAAYTRFQTLTIRFKDADTLTTTLDLQSTRDYKMELAGVPLIDSVQDTVSSRDVRHYGADALIKAPVPCFVQLSFTIFRPIGSDDLDTDAVKDALCAEVNTVGFVGKLYASRLLDVVHNFLSNDDSVGAVDMYGRIKYPSGDDLWIRNSEVLTVVDDPDNLVTYRTVQFFTDPDSIGISFETAIAPEL